LYSCSLQLIEGMTLVSKCDIFPHKPYVLVIIVGENVLFVDTGNVSIYYYWLAAFKSYCILEGPIMYDRILYHYAVKRKLVNALHR